MYAPRTNHLVTQIYPLWKGAGPPPHSIPNIPWHPFLRQEELSSWKWRYRTRGAPDGQGRAERDNRFGLRDKDNGVSPTSNATYLLKNESTRLHTLQMMPLLWSFTQEQRKAFAERGGRMGDACGDLRRNIRNMHELLRVLACHKWISENSPADGRHKPNTVKSVFLRSDRSPKHKSARAGSLTGKQRGTE